MRECYLVSCSNYDEEVTECKVFLNLKDAEAEVQSLNQSINSGFESLIDKIDSLEQEGVIDTDEYLDTPYPELILTYLDTEYSQAELERMENLFNEDIKYYITTLPLYE